MVFLSCGLAATSATNLWILSKFQLAIDIVGLDPVPINWTNEIIVHERSDLIMIG